MYVFFNVTNLAPPWNFTDKWPILKEQPSVDSVPWPFVSTPTFTLTSSETSLTDTSQVPWSFTWGLYKIQNSLVILYQNQWFANLKPLPTCLLVPPVSRQMYLNAGCPYCQPRTSRRKGRSRYLKITQLNARDEELERGDNDILCKVQPQLLVSFACCSLCKPVVYSNLEQNVDISMARYIRDVDGRQALLQKWNTHLTNCV